MENASKALIIAGAILLSILIIGLGMLIFNQAKEAITGSNLDKEQIEAVNSRYEPYLGDNVKGSKVKTLCTNIKSNNLVADEDETYSITIDFDGKEAVTASDIDAIKTSIGNGKYYTVKAEYSTTTKLIEKITISLNS